MMLKKYKNKEKCTKIYVQKALIPLVVFWCHHRRDRQARPICVAVSVEASSKTNFYIFIIYYNTFSVPLAFLRRFSFTATGLVTAAGTIAVAGVTGVVAGVATKVTTQAYTILSAKY